MWPFRKKLKLDRAWEKQNNKIDEGHGFETELVEKFKLWRLATPWDPTKILDVRELPASKERLTRAFATLVAFETDHEAREDLIRLGLTLAYFQEDIGSTPLTLYSDEELENFNPEKILAVIDFPKRIDEWDAAMASASRDLDEMEAIYERSIELANIRSSRKLQQLAKH